MNKFLSLRAKMLMFTFGVVAVLVGLSLAVTHRFVAARVQQEIGEELEKTEVVFKTFMQERARWLLSQSLVVAEDPRFTATLDILDPDLEYQSRTVLREARRFQNIIGSDIFLVVNQNGRVLTRLEVSISEGGELGDLSTVRAALEGTEASGIWKRESAELLVRSVPIRDAGEILGTLSVGCDKSSDFGPILEDLVLDAESEPLLQALRSGDRSRVVNLARKILTAGGDLVAVTDATGSVLTLIERQVSYGADLSSVPKIQEAIDGLTTVGLQVDRDRVVHLVCVPVWSQDEVIGALATGFSIDDRLAANLQSMTHSQISFLLNETVVASTWPNHTREYLAASLPSDVVARAEGQTARFEMLLDNETYLGLLGPMDVASAQARGYYLIQFSLDQAIGFLTTIERVLLLIGIAVLAAAALFSFTGASRITRPVKALVEGTRRLADGALGHRIQVRSHDEIGELADSFNNMAEALTRSYDALEASEWRYRDLFDNAHDIVYTTDLELRLTSLNKAVTEKLGYEPNELVGKPLYELLAAEDASRLKETERLLSPEHARPVAEAQVLSKDGNPVALEIVSRWIIESGKAVGIHGIARDITERKEREEATHRFREQLHEAEKLRALGEMAAGVAHNFNNLLTGVMGYAELMKLKEDIPEAIRADADKILQSAQRCSVIVRRIQTFGRPIDMTQLEPVDLNQVVRDTIEITKPRWKTAAEQEGKHVQLSVDLNQIALIQSIPSAWEEILSNLIFNAVDAMPKGGTIGVTTLQEDGKVIVEVSDTGTGMDEETQRRVFEPFFTTKSTEKGTGLGLSTVWGLVQSQGGIIQIETAPGKGTTFVISVPVVTPSDAAEEKVEGLSSLSGLRVLIVDDDFEVRDFMPKLLPGHIADTAESGDEALEKMRGAAYDLVITDWVMSGMSGLELAEKVKQKSPDTTVVLITGWEFKGTPADDSDAVDLVLSKPFDSIKLNRALQQAVEPRNRAGALHNT